MHPQKQGRLGQPRGPREVNANTNAQPTAAVKVTLPQIGPPNGAVKQENVPANGVASVTNDSRDIADATNGAKFRALGEEQAEENRQEQLTLPPPIQSLDEQSGDDLEHPAIAAERAIHHGFMNQALDMVNYVLLLSTLFSVFLVISFSSFAGFHSLVAAFQRHTFCHIDLRPQRPAFCLYNSHCLKTRPHTFRSNLPFVGLAAPQPLCP